MNKSAVHAAAVQDTRYGTIFGYFVPELINAILLYSLIVFVDEKLVAELKSTSAYAMVGVTNTLMVFINKIAEGLSVGAVILCGQYQGRQDFVMVGKAAAAALWGTAIVGACISGFLYTYASWIFEHMCLPPEMVAIGVPFLRLRAISIFLMFIFFALIGFFRGVKNTRATMYFYLLGAAVFAISDYILIRGQWGFPALGFNGSAIASILQYAVMLLAASLYIVFRKDYRQYHIRLYAISRELVSSLFSLSWPVMFDKATLQLEKIWIVSLVAPMGTYALGALNVVKNMESLAFIPVGSFGQIITLLVSNEYGAGNLAGIKTSIKRTILMASVMMFSVMLLLALKPTWFITIFDKQNVFTTFASRAFPIIGILTFFDLLQLILAGALRGTANVRVVMATRLMTAILFFVPLSYAMASIPFQSDLVRFVAIYGSYNVVNCIAGIIYYYWFHSGYWNRQPDKIV